MLTIYFLIVFFLQKTNEVDRKRRKSKFIRKGKTTMAYGIGYTKRKATKCYFIIRGCKYVFLRACVIICLFLIE